MAKSRSRPSTYLMLVQVPVEVYRDIDGSFTASLVNMPNVVAHRGVSEASAIRNLQSLVKDTVKQIMDEIRVNTDVTE